MTPLILNLLAEERQAEHASARDPLKLTIIGAVGLVLLTVGIGVLIMMWAGRRKTQAEDLEEKWKSIASSPTAGNFRKSKKLANDLVDIHYKRVLLAPQLARIKDLVPPTIHFTQLSFRVSMEATSRNVAPIGDSKDTPKPKLAERLSLRLEGGAVGARPPIEVDSFLQAMRKDSVLSNQFQEVTLRSIGNAPVMADGKATQDVMAQFVIECLYKERR